MSLLATAGIYLVLDVNSPLPGHHLNRYEPWITYNPTYLENVYKVVEQFSYYNNTLGFFAGNEIVNDKTSAKAMVRDIKLYIENNSPRTIPVGYSAADDLHYRMSMSDYLECVDDSLIDTVDFYGVNSYQWCGEQTFYTSGYNILVDDYSHYTRPVFLSEFGCNEVTPRVFDEIQALYSNDMVDVFLGGLVYEYSQEPNNYGLVTILPDGNVELSQDFFQLKNQYEVLPDIDYQFVASSMKMDASNIQSRLKQQKHALPQCKETYSNIDITKGLPQTVGEELIEHGVQVERGRFLAVGDDQLASKHTVFSADKAVYAVNPRIQREVDIMSGSEIIRKHRSYNCTYADLDLDLEYDFDSDIDDQSQESPLVKAYSVVASFFANLFKG